MAQKGPSSLPPMSEHPEPQEDELLTTKQVAQRLKLTPQTVQRLINRGELTASRVAGAWRISRSELEAFLLRTRSGR
jgi:excisionase family DNA binding protein